MLRVSNFIERYPTDGAQVTEPTAAYLGYTHRYLFVAFICRDKKPELIRGHMLARDSLGDDDSVQLSIPSTISGGHSWRTGVRGAYAYLQRADLFPALARA